MTEWLFPERDVGPDDIGPEDVDIRRFDTRDIAPGTSILVAGPVMTGKRRFGVDVLSGSSSRTACIVTTKKSANRVNDSFRAAVEDGDEWDLSIVDCNGSINRARKTADYTLEQVSSPSDLTGIGIKLSGILQQWHHRGVEDPRVQLHSLSTLLMYTDLKRVYRFVHVVLSRLQRVGAVNVFTLDTSKRDRHQFNKFAQLFDAVIEVRETDDGREFRVRGESFGPKSWTRY